LLGAALLATGAATFTAGAGVFVAGALAAGAFAVEALAGAVLATGAFAALALATGAALARAVVVFAFALAVLLSATVAFATALVFPDFLTLLVCAAETAARVPDDFDPAALPTAAFTAGALAADLDALVSLGLDAAPVRPAFRDDCVVEGILGYSLCHPALETGQAAVHPAVNGSETLARTGHGRRPPGRSDVPVLQSRKKGHGLPQEPGPTWGK